MRIVPVVRIVTFVVVAFGPAIGVLAEDEPLAVSPATLSFSTPPGLPPCVKTAALKGDPAKGAAVVFAKTTAGCRVPWHWHTATEQLLFVSGTGIIEMKDGRPLRLQTGAYTVLPGHHLHEVMCVLACTMFVLSDGAFDIHYVDQAGNEIPPEQALKSGATHPH